MLFCSELCKQTAKTIRYVRAVRADGRIKRPDVAEAVRISLAHIYAGGYPAAERKLTVEQRKTVFARAKSLCQMCGAAATEVDHIGEPIDGDINHPDNLQALCSACHRQKTMRRIRPSTNPVVLARAAEVQSRIRAPKPVRHCDSTEWAQEWRAVSRQRKAMAQAALTAAS
jgi:5-methylcytosine-specific restriction endonuclease McrA